MITRYYPLPGVPQNLNRVNRETRKGRGGHGSNGVSASFDVAGYVPLDSGLTGTQIMVSRVGTLLNFEHSGGARALLD
jgi:hypothetical protein